MTMNEAILVVNAGSSSIKFSLFACPTLNLIHHTDMPIDATGNVPVFDKFFKELPQYAALFSLKAVGHRVVHGGKDFLEPIRITYEVINEVSALIP
jgi:acetate kinase